MGVFRGNNPVGDRVRSAVTSGIRQRVNSGARMPFGGVPARAALRALERQQQPQAAGLGEQFTQPMPRNTYGSGS